MSHQIVQVYPYYTNNGCSVKIGIGKNRKELLCKEMCEIFEFVETFDEVQKIKKND